MSKSVSIDEFLQRVGSQPEANTWSALIVSNSDAQQLVDDLKDSLSIFAECEVGCLSANINTSNLVERISHTNEDYLILWDFEQWDNHNWYQLDCQRSKLMRKYGVVLILSPESAKTMFSYAPNIVSWLGSRVYSFLKDTELLSIEERQERLEALREWSGLTDSQVIDMAEAQTLPPEPEYAEWLVLLDRGDLIEQ
ncbi:ABC transporter permease [Nostoc sp. FACHB-87]|uniref:ABC transporter permease n=1 Tax=Nostocaceae TaxID=1162 RepID=UPI0016853E63|nr:MULTISPECIES: ABC transporter permease [Nostocaceae]MBD2298607.1 ABC transporter permease [Nostoc sp. FACHB-190]MBD2454386.1 ABC transporter permease [Nostoc sp. FACHB-87]MBD2474428.1 ABC transporter permease [Anabaena sp. FACHB-83]